MDRRDRDRDRDRDRGQDRNPHDDNRNLRHNSYSSNGGPRQGHHNMHNNINGKGRSVGPMPRHSPPPPPPEPTNNNYTHNQHDDLIHYIYESWDKVYRELRGGGRGDIKYYQDTRQNPNFTPFDLEGWVCRNQMQSLKRQPHNS